DPGCAMAGWLWRSGRDATGGPGPHRHATAPGLPSGQPQPPGHGDRASRGLPGQTLRREDLAPTPPAVSTGVIGVAQWAWPWRSSPGLASGTTAELGLYG